MEMLIPSEELQHHGIKGQKWGRRRFQNEDGTLTPAGKERYDDDTPNNPARPKHRDKLITKYEREGFSRSDAEYLAERRIKAEKIVAGAAAVTVVAATAYAVNKHIKTKVDIVIKEGAELQRISGNTSLERALYVSYNKTDNLKYRGLYGMNAKAPNGLQQMTLRTKSAIKIPSRQKAQDTFIDMLKNDKEFNAVTRRSLKDMKSKDYFPFGMKSTINEFVDNGKLSSKKEYKDLYDAFNMGFANTRGDTKTSNTMFYNKLKELGYDAITDINDQKYSGYRAKAPTIIFNNTKVGLEKVTELSKDQITSDYLSAKKILAGQEKVENILSILKDTGKMGVGVGALSSGIYAMNSKAIREYRKEHPNSKLTDKEIIKLIQDDRK